MLRVINYTSYWGGGYIEQKIPNEEPDSATNASPPAPSFLSPTPPRRAVSRSNGPWAASGSAWWHRLCGVIIIVAISPMYAHNPQRRTNYLTSTKILEASMCLVGARWVLPAPRPLKGSLLPPLSFSTAGGKRGSLSGSRALPSSFVPLTNMATNVSYPGSATELPVL